MNHDNNLSKTLRDSFKKRMKKARLKIMRFCKILFVKSNKLLSGIHCTVNFKTLAAAVRNSSFVLDSHDFNRRIESSVENVGPTVSGTTSAKSPTQIVAWQNSMEAPLSAGSAVRALFNILAYF